MKERKPLRLPVPSSPPTGAKFPVEAKTPKNEVKFYDRTKAIWNGNPEKTQFPPTEEDPMPQHNRMAGGGL